MYQLPEIDFSKIKNNAKKLAKSETARLSAMLAVLLVIFGVYSGIFSQNYVIGQIRSFMEQNLAMPQVQNNEAQANSQVQTAASYNSNVPYEQAIIDAVKQASPSVVSIIISKDLPVYEQHWVNPFGENSPFSIEIPQYVQKGTQNQQVGAGSGFIVSTDGMVLTNKHVVSQQGAEYTVLTNDGQKYKAKVLAIDPAQDLALVKIQSDKTFPAIKLGTSAGIQLGQTAIAIGNALGQFRNTVSVGIISGLGRTVSASDQGGTFSETLEGIIQTDAAINSGNSGGPLINLKGEVVGINTAMAQGAENIGFAIPIDRAKKDIQQVVTTNKIVYPFLGVRYVIVDSDVRQKFNLPVDYGAYVTTGQNGEAAVVPGAAADKAGIRQNDIILEINGEKITIETTMSSLINKYNPGDKVTLKIMRNGEQQNIDVVLGERS